MHNEDLLEKGLEALKIEFDGEVVQKLIQFKDILLEWNEKINLTTIVEEKDVYIKHFIDSATCLCTGYINEGKSVIDVGTGAGFPGIPIKIMKKNLNITLLDSLNKRISYLSDACRRLDLDKTILVHSRAEDAGSNSKYREKYDVVLSRAVAPMNVLVEYCMPFLKVGGHFLCQKGPKCEDELKEAQKAIHLLGGEVEEVKSFLLPFTDIKHYVIVVKKNVTTPTKYPRKAGKPSTEPII